MDGAHHFAQQSDIWHEILQYMPDTSSANPQGSSPLIPIMQVSRLWRSFAEPIFFRLLHFTEASKLELAATAFTNNSALSAKVACHTRVVHMLYNTVQEWETGALESEEVTSRRVAGYLTNVLTHVCTLKELVCYELVTPELLAAARAASADGRGYGLLRELDIELDIGSPGALAQLARFGSLRHLTLQWVSELRARDSGALLDGVPAWDMPALLTLAWSEEPHEDDTPARWLAFLARCTFPALRTVHFALYPLSPDAAAAAAAFFQAHPHIARFSMDVERYGTRTIVPQAAVPRLHLCGSDDEYYAGLAAAIHPAVRELVLDTSPSYHESDLDRFLDALKDARSAGLKTVMIRFHDPRVQPFRWVEDPNVAMQASERAHVSSFRSSMLHHVQVFTALGINLVDELGLNLLGQKCMD